MYRVVLYIEIDRKLELIIDFTSNFNQFAQF